MGALLGVALAVLISTVGIVMPPPPNANIGYTALIRIVPSVVVMAFLVGLIATILAAIFPASRVARTPIDEALRQNV
jgi:putative ABC transport system permease protein